MAEGSRPEVDRRVVCGEMIARGTPVYDAMIKAGFGQRYAAGNAETFAAFLADHGFMPKAAVGRARVGRVPAPPADEKEEE